MLAALVGGLTNAQIGNRLHISGAHGRGACVLVAAQARVARWPGWRTSFAGRVGEEAEVVAPALGVTQRPHQPLDEIIASATFDLATLSVVIRAVLRSSRS